MLARSKELINADIHSFEIMQMAWLETSELDATNGSINSSLKTAAEEEWEAGVGFNVSLTT